MDTAQTEFDGTPHTAPADVLNSLIAEFEETAGGHFTARTTSDPFKATTEVVIHRARGSGAGVIFSRLSLSDAELLALTRAVNSAVVQRFPSLVN